MAEARIKPGTFIEEPVRERPEQHASPAFQVLRAASENTRMMNLTIKELMARRRWILAAMLLSAGISSFWFWRHPPMYRSTVTFFVAGAPLPEKNQPIYLGLQTDPQTLVHLATSTEMFDRLIERFDLRTRFKLNGIDGESQSRLHSILRNRILASVREEDLVEVRVADTDRSMAAAMANAIFEFARSIQREAQQADLSRQLRIFSEVIDSTDRIARTRAADLLDVASRLNSARNHIDNDGTRPLAQAENDLIALSAEVTSANQDLIRQRREHMNLLVLAAQPDADRIRLKSRAMEDLGTLPFWDSAKWVLVITIAAGIAATVILLIIIENWFTPPTPRTVPARR